ncbi:MAG: hypothetical protein ACRDJ3_09165, partial [Solirubrobacteraceae bacterium]
MTCLGCVAATLSSGHTDGPALPVGSIQVDPGTAGGSAMREYARRHDAREQRARERMGLLGVGIARLPGDPASTRAWRQGAE